MKDESSTSISHPVSHLEHCYIFLDTNVFIDAYSHPELYYELFAHLKSKGNLLLTINCVVLEFLKGSRSTVEFKKKKQFLSEILNGEIMTITRADENAALEIALIFQNQGGKSLLTDFYLISILRRTVFGDKIFVMTKNHSDFPTTFLNREAILTIPGEKDIQTYALYRFDRKKYTEFVDNLI